MDAIKEQKTKDTVNDFVAKGYMFTAYDVTKTLRNAGEFVKHSDVNAVVQSMRSNGEMDNYEREVVDVGSSVQPFVYYHPHSDVSKYDQHWVENNPNQDGMKNDPASGGSSSGYTPLSSVTSKPTAPTATTSFTPPSILGTVTMSILKKQGIVQTTKSENRLQIKLADVKKAGFTPHQTVYVHIAQNNDSVIVKDTPDTAIAKRKALYVNKDGRLRICSTILNKLHKGGNYKVVAASGMISVTPF